MIGFIIYMIALECFLIWILVGKIAYYKKHGEWYEDANGGKYLPLLIVIITIFISIVFLIIEICKR